MGATTLTTPAPNAAQTLRGLFEPGRLVVFLGAFLTLAIATLIALRGLTLEAKGFFGLCVFVALVAGFVVVPWRMVAGMIPLFVALPALKVFVTPAIGGLKDIVSLSALAAAGIVLVRRRAARRPARLDRLTMLLVGGIFGLYLANGGGLITGETGYGAQWFQAVRLFNEPLALFVVGLTLRNPERTLDAARKAVIASAVGLALYGLLQQVLGVSGLLKLGYLYGEQVRTIGPYLRSFGTLDDSFAYASYLLLALAMLLLSRRLRPGQYPIALILSAGLLVSFVRTAAIVALGVAGLALARRGHGLLAMLLVFVSIAAAATVFTFASEQTTTRTVTINPNTYLTLNGRTKLWKSRIGTPSAWVFGQGVGATGTAAERAQESLSGKRQGNSSAKGSVNDSAYLTLIADIGFVGLFVYLALVARIFALGREAAAAGCEYGWLAIAVVLVIPVDGLSRESFTAFPTPYVGMLLAGLACAAWLRRRAEPGSVPP